MLSMLLNRRETARRQSSTSDRPYRRPKKALEIMMLMLRQRRTIWQSCTVSCINLTRQKRCMLRSVSAAESMHLTGKFTYLYTSMISASWPMPAT